MAKVGRPRMYNNAKDLQAKADEYFALKDTQGKPYTITGLALYLGFADRQSLIDYAKDGEFSCTIKAIKGRVEEFLEERLFETSPTGTIFNLKNNFGWKDKSEQEVNMTANLAVAKPTQLSDDEWANKFKK